MFFCVFFGVCLGVCLGYVFATNIFNIDFTEYDKFERPFHKGKHILSQSKKYYCYRKLYYKNFGRPFDTDCMVNRLSLGLEVYWFFVFHPFVFILMHLAKRHQSSINFSHCNLLLKICRTKLNQTRNRWLWLWCLTSLSTIFQLYRGCQSYW